MKLDEIDIHELLPQQEPFVMVDQLTAFDEKITATSLTVRADNIFVEDGWLNECALAENIAQTCAARLGYINKYILKRAIQIGFIGAIRDMTVVARPHVGDRLETVIEVMDQVIELTRVTATITCNGRQIASAQMKIALSDEVIA